MARESKKRVTVFLAASMDGCLELLCMVIKIVLKPHAFKAIKFDNNLLPSCIQ